MSESTILNFVKNHRAANFLTLDYDRHRKVWVLGQELRHEIPNFPGNRGEREKRMD